MKAKTEKTTTEYLNMLLAFELLRPMRTSKQRFSIPANVNQGEFLTAVIAGNWDKARRELNEDQLDALMKIKGVFQTLAKKLLACENPEMLIHVAEVVDGINTGRVYIAAEGQEMIETN